jgi:hypothetical protein
MSDLGSGNRAAETTGPKATRIATVIAALAAGASLAGGAFDPDRFAFSYLVAYTFATSIALGALFWVMAHHASSAVWSVVVRRLLENTARTLRWAVLSFAPIIFLIPRLYAWARPSATVDRVLELKRGWLNTPRFLIAALVCLGSWAILAELLARLSVEQDRTKNPDLTRRMRAISPPGLVLLGITTTIAAFDWLMSLDYHWYSTIFGVYFWIQSILAALAALTLLILALQAAGYLRDSVTKEHLHDLGKLTFGFVIFWAYVAFSQYFLIWYANLPEETAWYLNRRVPGWNGWNYLLIFGHFVIPFFVLMPRTTKRSSATMAGVAAWLLAFHYLDLYWTVMPNLTPAAPVISWLDVSTAVALGAGLVALVCRGCERSPLTPQGDPALAESIAFKNT